MHLPVKTDAAELFQLLLDVGRDPPASSYLKVMISSTITDMKDERDTAHRIIEYFHFDALRSETYPAIGLSSEETCQKMAEECDIFIGIYGYRYGSVPKQLKMSVTEMEYLRAKEVDPSKILVYLKRAESGSKIERRQERFRQRVEDFRMGYFRHSQYSNLDQLAIQIEQDLTAWITHLAERDRRNKVLIEMLKNDLAAANKNLRLAGYYGGNVV